MKAHTDRQQYELKRRHVIATRIVRPGPARVYYRVFHKNDATTRGDQRKESSSSLMQSG